jgi:hypothetical protein
MLMVIVILGILSAVAMRAIDGALERSRFEATVEEMDQLVQAMVGNPELFSGGVRTDFGYYGDVGALPPSLDALVTNPGYATWDGPYISRDFSQDPNGFKTDAWGNTYGYSGVTITSGGGGSQITRNIAGSAAELSSNTVKGVVIDGVGNPPGSDAGAVTVRIVHPNGSGGKQTRTTNPNSAGSYVFSDQIPIGNHEMTAVYATTGDSAKYYVSVLPNSTTIANIRLPGNLWSESGGSGQGTGGLVYQAGSALTKNGGRDVQFRVQNNTGSDITITSIQATYGYTAWYEEIKIDGTKVFQNDNPRGGSGETKTFSAIVIQDGDNPKIEYKKFKDAQSGGASDVNMQGDSFSVTFSDGSVINFTL